MRIHRFIATVSRIETVRKLKRTFKEQGGRGLSVQVRQAEENVASVAESNVVLLWCGFISISDWVKLVQNSLISTILNDAQL